MARRTRFPVCNVVSLLTTHNPSQEMRYANYPGTTDCELQQPHLPMVFFLPFMSTNYFKTAKQMERESKSTHTGAYSVQ